MKSNRQIMSRLWIVQRGFTIIELLLIMSIISIIAAFGASTYRDYADTRRVSVAADEVANVLATAKSRAISQVKPAACGSAELDGYRVVMCPGGCTTSQTYVLQAYCGGVGQQIGNPYRLPQGVVFGSSAQRTVLFRTLTGATESSGDTVIRSGTKEKTISVSNAGVIAMSGLEVISPTAAPTVPPTPSLSPVPITLNFSAAQASIPYNTATTLNWTANGSVSFCDASGGWSGSKDLSGSESTWQLTSTTVFTLRCQGPGGDETRNITVTVAPAPIINFIGNTVIPYSASTTLSWSSTNTTSCIASGAWSGTKPISGTESTGAITTTRTYTLVCNGVSADVTITVLPSMTIKTAYSAPGTTPSGQVTDSTTGWKNVNIRMLATVSIKAIGLHIKPGTGGIGGYEWEVYKDTSGGGVIGSSTLLQKSSDVSGNIAMGLLPDSGNYYYAKLVVPQSFSANQYLLIRVNMINGHTWRGPASSQSPLNFDYYSTGTSQVNGGGNFAVRVLY